jgi:hypothetical protein
MDERPRTRGSRTRSRPCWLVPRGTSARSAASRRGHPGPPPDQRAQVRRSLAPPSVPRGTLPVTRRMAVPRGTSSVRPALPPARPAPARGVEDHRAGASRCPSTGPTCERGRGGPVRGGAPSGASDRAIRTRLHMTGPGERRPIVASSGSSTEPGADRYRPSRTVAAIPPLRPHRARHRRRGRAPSHDLPGRRRPWLHRERITADRDPAGFLASPRRAPDSGTSGQQPPPHTGR